MEAERRPDPDKLLRQMAKNPENAAPRGKLKIFFGYAAGVGKTYAMLEAAHAAKEQGVDVAAGYIEPHTRPATLALLDGLEQLPTLAPVYKGVTLREFDLDGAIARHPQLILVDELAHTNAECCRHRKRFKDIEEILKAGIDVYTTVNVQHLESLNDIVASITGIIVQERVPDSVFDSADQVELVDIEPDDLLERLQHGKVYKEGQARRAMDHFFTKENLVALREIALRRTADRVNRAAEKEKSAQGGYYTEEHILVCLSSSPSNAKVIRAAARMAEAFRCPFTALFVETPDSPELTGENQERLRKNLRLSEQLGARIATVYGDNVAEQIAGYARESGVSKIVLGRTGGPRRGLFPRPNLVEQLTGLAPIFDIFIIPDNAPSYSPRRNRASEKLTAADLLKSVGILTVTTVAAVLFRLWGFSEANVVTLYILGVLFISMTTHRKIYGAAASLLSVLVFNFFFTAPYFTLQFFDPGYYITFTVMFLASFITSALTARVRAQARQAAAKAHRTEVLLETSQLLQRADTGDLYGQMGQQLLRLLRKTVLLYPVSDGATGEPLLFPDPDAPGELEAYTAPGERAVAAWVAKNNKHAGATTDTLPGSKCLYLAVRSHETVFAVAGIPLGGEAEGLGIFERSLLLAMLNEFALAVEKQQVAGEKQQFAVEAEQERLRANLLRAISHDLRTPLTSISGNAGILMSNGAALDEPKKQALYTDIYDDSMWLINLVENLLAVTRIENGTMNLQMEPELIGDVIDEALSHVNRKCAERLLSVELESDVLMARMDARLIIQVLINIVDNAVKYTPPGSHIVLSARQDGALVRVEVADDGPGVSDEAKERLFDMFYTEKASKRADGRRGLGLGLSLCRSIVLAHGGTITVRDNHPTGTVFSFTLKSEEVT